MIDYFNKLVLKINNFLNNYQNQKLKESILPWVNALDDASKAMIKYLTILKDFDSFSNDELASLITEANKYEEASYIHKEPVLDVITYNVKYIEVYAINSLLIATLRDDKTSVTESRRVTYMSNNFYELERVNELSRSIVKKNISRKAVLKKINKIKVDKNMFLICFGYIIAAGSFTIFFGGKILDSLISILISIVIFILDTYLNKKNISKIIYNFLASFIIGIIAILFSKICQINIDKVIIGDIMLLIPGLAIFTSIYDIVKGDTTSGTNRFVDGIFLALSIASGIAISLLLGGKL